MQIFKITEKKKNYPHNYEKKMSEVLRLKDFSTDPKTGLVNL